MARCGHTDEHFTSEVFLEEMMEKGRRTGVALSPLLQRYEGVEVEVTAGIVS